MIASVLSIMLLILIGICITLFDIRCILKDKEDEK